METKDLLEFGPFRADLHRRALMRDGESVSLPGKAFDVLVVLLQNAGATVSKDDLLKTVWPDTFVEEGNLTQTVFLLRKALGDSDSQPYIVTVPRQGYRFVGTVVGGGPVPTVAAPDWRRFRWHAVAAVVAVAGIATLVALRPRGTAALAEPVRFEIPFENANAAPVVSPDGKRLALVPSFQTASGTDLIWIRDLKGMTPYPLAGTENATFAFWSADSCCLGFMAQGKLKTVKVGGGPVTVVTDAPNGRGGAWSGDGTIVFAPFPAGPLHSVPATGGASVPVTALDAAKDQNSHRFPVFLPDGKRFLFLAHSPIKENLWIWLGELGKPTATPVIRSDSNAVYVPQARDGGLLLYVRNRELLEQPFHLGRGEVTGEPRVIATSILYGEAMKFAHFTASAGMLAYRTGAETRANLRWLSRTGETLGEVAGSEGIWQINLAREGSVLAGARMDPETGTGDIWAFDLQRGGANRVTRHPAWESLPVLSAKGKEVVFASDRGPRNAYVKAVEGAGLERPLLPASTPAVQRNPYDWSSDGKYILYARFEKNNEDLWVLETGTGREFPLAQSGFNESQGQFSADGKWVAYTSDETGKPEVYVREFLAPDRLADQRTKVSVDGGVEPRWRQDGKEIYYVGPNGALEAVPIQAGAAVRAGKPGAVLPPGTLGFGFGWHSSFSYAANGNGQKFVLVTKGQTVVSPIAVVLKWAE